MNPKERATLRNLLTEMSNSKTRIEAERDHQKELKKRAKDELGMPTKKFSALVTIHHKNSFAEFSEVSEDVIETYTEVFGVNQTPTDDDEA